MKSLEESKAVEYVNTISKSSDEIHISEIDNEEALLAEFQNNIILNYCYIEFGCGILDFEGKTIAELNEDELLQKYGYKIEIELPENPLETGNGRKTATIKLVNSDDDSFVSNLGSIYYYVYD